jgi:hypothetical protein
LLWRRKWKDAQLSRNGASHLMRYNGVIRYFMSASTPITFQSLTSAHVEGERIPLRVVETVEMRWERELERELRTQFDPRQAPLMRAVLLYQEAKAVFILVAHHSIADGFSSAFAIRDVLEALSGQPLDRLPLMPSREEIFGLPRGRSTEGRPVSQSSVAVAASLATDKREASVPHIQRMSLVPFLTSVLQNSAKEEGTTVQGALCAALVLAGRQIDRDWHDKPLRVNGLLPSNIALANLRFII